MQLRLISLLLALVLIQSSNGQQNKFKNGGKTRVYKTINGLGEARFTSAIWNKLALKGQQVLATTAKPNAPSWSHEPSYTSDNGPSYTSGYGPSYTSGSGPSYTSGSGPSGSYTSGSSAPSSTTGSGPGPGPGPDQDVTSSDTSLSQGPSITSSSAVPGEPPSTSKFPDEPNDNKPNGIDNQPHPAVNPPEDLVDPDDAGDNLTSRAIDDEEIFNDDNENKNEIVLNGQHYIVYKNNKEDKANFGRAAPSRRNQLRRRRQQLAKRRRLQQQQYNRITRNGNRKSTRRPPSRYQATNLRDRRKSPYRRGLTRRGNKGRRQAMRRRAILKRRRQLNGNGNRLYRLRRKPTQRIIIREFNPK